MPRSSHADFISGGLLSLHSQQLFILHQANSYPQTHCVCFSWHIILLGKPFPTLDLMPHIIETILTLYNDGLWTYDPGAGNGNPLQHSCLENAMDRGAWWATVRGVTKSWTRLSDFTSLRVYKFFTKTGRGPWLRGDSALGLPV